ncbi:hypothetical protein [Streptomyces sp. NPDC021562]
MVAGALLLCGGLLSARELERRAAGRSGGRGLLWLAAALCLGGVLIGQA